MDYEIINITQQRGGKYLMEARFIFEVKKSINAAEMEMFVNLDKNMNNFDSRVTILPKESYSPMRHTNNRSITRETFALKLLDSHQGAQPTGFYRRNLPVPPETAASELILSSRVPVVYVDSWPTGDGVHYRMSGKCELSHQSELPANVLSINITLNKPTIQYQHLLADLLSSSREGTWYYVETKYGSYFPGMGHSFQVTYVGQTPPIGYCYTSLPGHRLKSSSPSQTLMLAEEPHPETFRVLNSASRLLTSTQTAVSISTHRVPVIFVDSWPTGDGVHYRMNGRCDCDLQSEIPPNYLNINITFNKPTIQYQHWIAEIQSAASDGSWYYVYNKYTSHPPVLSHSFQVTFAGKTPPTGYCYTSFRVSPLTAPMSSTSQPSTSSSTEKPHPWTYRELINSNRVPVVHVDSWPTGDGVRYRMNGKCDFILQSEIPANSLHINITFNKSTIHYQHWIAEITSSAADGSWYYVYNIYNTYPPVLSYAFQVTYAGRTPPTGYCFPLFHVVIPTPPTSLVSHPLESSASKDLHSNFFAMLNS
ncbi:hypothetical protein ACJMK2_007097, partial [Sinanodonta woodiana]